MVGSEEEAEEEEGTFLPDKKEALDIQLRVGTREKSEVYLNAHAEDGADAEQKGRRVGPQDTLLAEAEEESSCAL